VNLESQEVCGMRRARRLPSAHVSEVSTGSLRGSSRFLRPLSSLFSVVD